MTVTLLQQRNLNSVNVKDYGAQGDGVTDDTSKIQAALNALNAMGGGTMFLPKGTFNLSNTLIGYNYVNIIGSGSQSILNMTNTALSAPIIQLFGTSGNHLHDIILRDFSVNGVGASYISSLGQAARGIYIRYADRVHVQNLWITNIPSSGMTLDEGIDCVALNCYINSVGYNGIGSGETGVTNVIIMGCSIYNATTDGLQINNIEGGGIFANNICENCGNYGIRILYSTSITNHVIVTGNICKNNTFAGITVNWCSGVVVTNNQCHSNQQQGIYITNTGGTPQGVVVSGNSCDANVIAGIELNNAVGTVVNNNACMNTANGSSNAYGIYILSSSGFTCNGNIVYNNGSVGIKASQSQYGVIVGNVAYNNGLLTTFGDGISLQDTGTACQYIIISDNVCFDNQGTKTQRNGISLQNLTANVILKNNNVATNKTAALSITTTGVGILVKDNPGALGPTVKSSNYTVTPLDSVVVVTGTTTITLPTAVGNVGFTVTIKNVVVSPLAVHSLWNQHRRQEFPRRPNMIGEPSSHSWGSLLPSCLFCWICQFYT